jgi:hypothetical protein
VRTKTKLRETVVYWRPDGTDRDGQRKFAPPVELPARWEDGQLDVQTGQNEVWRSATQVFFLAKVVPGGPPVPDIKEGGFLWRGSYSRLASRTVPTDNADVVQIERVGRVPVRRNRQLFVTAYA